MSDKTNSPDGRATEATSTTTTTTTVVASAATSAPQRKRGTSTTAAPMPSRGPSPALTPEEEKVIRMRYGKSLQPHEALDFAPNASMETRLKLALIEANLLEAFEAEALDPDPQNGAPRSVFADHLDG